MIARFSRPARHTNSIVRVRLNCMDRGYGERHDYQNAIKCRKCGDVIESTSTHDFKICSCGACAVDGGHEYLRRSAPSLDDFIDLSVVEPEEPSDTLFFS